MNGNRVIAVIPARGGSKSVPRKNIRPLGGKPLIAWSIELAQQVPEIDRVIVSTEDPEITQISREYRAEVYRRPEDLATDQALVIDAVKHLVATLRSENENAEILVLLEPTCPFRSVEDVQDCLRLVADGGCDSAATFVDAALHPHRAWKSRGTCPRPSFRELSPGFRARSCRKHTS